MRPVLCCALLSLLSACGYESAQQVADNAALAADKAIERCEERRAETAAEATELRAALATQAQALAALRAELDAMKRAPAAKVPHLFGVDGTDLGPFAGYDVAWSEQLQAYYYIEHSTMIVYESADCTGQAFAYGDNKLPGFQYAVGSKGSIVELVGPAQKTLTARSAFYGGQCNPLQVINETLRPCKDTGIAAKYWDRDNLRVR